MIPGNASESKEIKMSSKKLLSVLLLQYGYPWFIAAFAGLILFVVLGFASDLRFFILALIWLFLLVPLVVAFLYFFYAMDPLTAFNAIPHKIIDQDDKVTVRILPEENPYDTDNSETPESVDNSGSSESHGISVGTTHNKDYTVNKNELKEMKRGNDCYLLFFQRKGWLWIPLDAFGDISSLNLFLKNFNPQ